MPGNKSEVKCSMVSRIKWHLPVQEEAEWLKLLLFAENITKKVTRMHLLNTPFYPTPANPGSNTNCLATSNGICTKRNKAWLGLLLFENKVNNNSQTWPFIYLTSLATFYSKTLLLKWVMPVKEYYEYEDEDKNMNEMANFSFGWYSHIVFFLLDTY